MTCFMTIACFTISGTGICYTYGDVDSSYKYIYALYQDQEEANKQQLEAMSANNEDLQRQIKEKYEAQNEEEIQKENLRELSTNEAESE